MADEAPVELLQRVPLFEDFERGDLQRLSRSFKQRVFDAGSTVADEGRTGAGFFVIETGEATVSVRGTEHGKLGPGDYFGEISMIDGKPRSASVEAVEQLTTLVVPHHEFLRLVDEEPTFAKSLLNLLCSRIRDAEARD